MVDIVRDPKAMVRNSTRPMPVGSKEQRQRLAALERREEESMRLLSSVEYVRGKQILRDIKRSSHIEGESTNPIIPRVHSTELVRTRASR